MRFRHVVVHVDLDGQLDVQAARNNGWREASSSAISDVNAVNAVQLFTLNIRSSGRSAKPALSTGRESIERFAFARFRIMIFLVPQNLPFLTVKIFLVL